MPYDFKALDFGAVRRLLERLTFSPYGADAARALEPAPSLEDARARSNAVSAARRALAQNAVPRFGAVPEVRAALRQSEHPGAALPPQALANLSALLVVGREMGRLVDAHPGLLPGSAAFAGAPALAALLDRVVSAAGRLKDDASDTLRDLHAQGHALRAEAQALVRARAAKADAAAHVLEPARPRWHGARAVLALRAGGADVVQGVRRGSAGGGREVLLEPLEAVAVNNRLEALDGRIQSETQAVLRAATDHVRGANRGLWELADAVAQVDLALAAGRLALGLDAHPPELASEGLIDLRQARHPLLQAAQDERDGPPVTPLDLRLDADQPLLVITGPNMGGKTVALKTVGLMALMALAGLHIPAAPGSRVGWFTRVSVDIGDHQSLQHQISTFAGHVEVLKDVLATADAASLVLLDELGTGTDPDEGAALAMAVLDELAERGVRGVVTTHLPRLKAFAGTHPRLRNASMRFDDETLLPTYELVVGQPGQSLGLTIAERRGLPEETVNRARAYLVRGGSTDLT
jgi:DNA mismatch repair protein MutS2